MTQRFTLEEAAAELKAPSTRWLAEWLRAHPRDKSGAPYYTPMGRGKVFRSEDIIRIEHALREGLTCHSTSGRRGPAKRRITKSEEPTSASEWNALADLLGDPSLKTKSATSSDASKSTSNGPRPKLSLVQGSPRS
jgi:hypothetical protein